MHTTPESIQFVTPPRLIGRVGTDYCVFVYIQAIGFDRYHSLQEMALPDENLSQLDKALLGLRPLLKTILQMRSSCAGLSRALLHSWLPNMALIRAVGLRPVKR